MIELVRADACVACDICIRVCPTDVFDRGPTGIPLIARQSDCQTCFMCEAYCPADALYVDPESTPLPPDRAVPQEHLGHYRREIGWGPGRRPGSLTAIGPELPANPPPRSNR
jgi:NAD-dependent dihydropyrimidine dehydrogenase PreA subunit